MRIANISRSLLDFIDNFNCRRFCEILRETPFRANYFRSCVHIYVDAYASACVRSMMHHYVRTRLSTGVLLVSFISISIVDTCNPLTARSHVDRVLDACRYDVLATYRSDDNRRLSQRRDVRMEIDRPRARRGRSNTNLYNVRPN